jgi:arginine/lysine/ornithine decarboxylase
MQFHHILIMIPMMHSSGAPVKVALQAAKTASQVAMSPAGKEVIKSVVKMGVAPIKGILKSKQNHQRIHAMTTHKPHA